MKIIKIHYCNKALNFNNYNKFNKKKKYKFKIKKKI